MVLNTPHRSSGGQIEITGGEIQITNAPWEF